MVRRARNESSRGRTLERFSGDQRSTVGSVVGMIVFLIGAFLAARLSWACNTQHGFNVPLKVVFALFSALGSWGYLVAYAFYKWGTCKCP